MAGTRSWNAGYHEGIMNGDQDRRLVTVKIDTWTGETWRLTSNSGVVYEWVRIPVSPIDPQPLELPPSGKSELSNFEAMNIPESNIIGIQVQLDRIEAKLDRLIEGPPRGRPNRLRRSWRAHWNPAPIPHSYRVLAQLGVKPYLQGHEYRRKDVENAIAKQTLRVKIAEAEDRGPG